ncbi:MAG TPA: hypothetical protein VHE99_00730 [Gammaproteobacteria bacterium]|nr:hypothetical protein [Gammaproteobacteria bacterium]
MEENQSLLTKPLIVDEEAQSTHSRVFLVFDVPKESDLSCYQRSALKALIGGLPTSVIFVDENDFDEHERVKSDRLNKYIALKGPVIKVKILGHRALNQPDSDGVFSNENAYPSESKTCGLFSKRQTAFFSVKKVANLIRLIKDPAVFIPKAESKQMVNKSLDNYLKISIISCFGEIFAQHLFNELFNKDSERLPLCFITAGRQDLLLEDLPIVGKSYHHYLPYSLLHLLLVLTTGFGIMTAVGRGAKIDDLAENAQLGLIISGSITALLSLNFIRKMTKSTSADKVVFVPDFTNCKDSKDLSISYEIFSKRDFKRMMEEAKSYTIKSMVL